MRRIAFAVLLAFSAVAAAPAQAAGLLQDLFGGYDRPAPVVYRYAPEQPRMRFIYEDALRVSRRPRSAVHKMVAAHRIQKHGIEQAHAHVVVKHRKLLAHAIAHRRIVSGPSLDRSSAKPLADLQAAQCCKHDDVAAGQIDNDTTLRIGDAYMTPQGLRIYRGRIEGTREASAFVDYRKASIGPKMKARLAELERRPSDGAQVNNSGLNPTLATTTHVGAWSAPKRTSLDARGRVIRVVGP